MFFVAGITGQVGGAVARRLLERGRAVRALARDPAKAADWSRQGVEVRRGDLTDVAAVAGALAGVEGAFLMIPPVMAPEPGYPEAKAVLAAYRGALGQAPPPRLALLSSAGSQQEGGLGNVTTTHLMEEALGDLPFPTAFVRAGSFLENYTPALDRAAATGWFDSFLAPTDRPFPMVATADIGAEVAGLLAGGWVGKRVVELGSYRTPDDLAAAMGEVLDREVRARAIPRDGWAAALEAMGLPRGRTAPYEEMLDGFNSGWIDFGVPDTERVAGTTTPARVFAAAKASGGKA